MITSYLLALPPLCWASAQLSIQDSRRLRLLGFAHNSSHASKGFMTDLGGIGVKFSINKFCIFIGGFEVKPDH